MRRRRRRLAAGWPIMGDGSWDGSWDGNRARAARTAVREKMMMRTTMNDDDDDDGEDEDDD